MKRINMAKFDRELREAGVPIAGVRGDGKIDFLDSATKKQRAMAQKILKAHRAEDVVEKRRERYRGIVSMDDFMEAFFEMTYENKPQKMDRLQAMRAKIKSEVK